MAGGIPIMEVTGRKDVQNGGRSIWKNDHGSGLFASLSKGKIHFFLLFATNLSYFSSFKLPYKIQLLAFRSSLKEEIVLHVRTIFGTNRAPRACGTNFVLFCFFRNSI